MRTDTASGIAAAATGIGILTFALFPLAIPFLLLTAVFAAPLVIIPVAAPLPIAIVAGVVVAIRRVWRWLGARRRPARTPIRHPVAEAHRRP
jgi:hypothetical protein